MTPTRLDPSLSPRSTILAVQSCWEEAGHSHPPSPKWSRHFYHLKQIEQA